MKIIHIIPNLSTGGAERFCIDICNKMSENNEVVLCTLFDLSDDMFLVNDMLSKVRHVSLGKRKGFDISIIWKIFQFVKFSKPAVVNTHLSSILYSSLTCMFFKKTRYFHTVHNLAEKEATNKINRYIRKFLFVFRFVTPISISKKVETSIKLLYGQRIISPIIVNGVVERGVSNRFNEVKNEIQGLKKDKSTKVFLSIGRIIPQKNLAVLLSVFRELQNENIILLHIGSEPAPSVGLTKELKRNSVSNVFWLGEKDNVQDYLACCDFFCLASIYEGLPITLLEAMYSRIVCVCTPVGGIPDVISNNKNGFLSKSAHYFDIKNTVLKVIKLGNNDLNKVKDKAQNNFKKGYTMSITAGTYLNTYQNYVG